MTPSLHTACRGSIAPTLREKMICILLLITLTSCVSGRSVMDATQRSYQAEENHNVTLEWTFKTATDGSFKSLNITCQVFADLTLFTLFHLREGVEYPKAQNERFTGRVQFDKDVLREGRLRFHMSRLRTDDSGLYKCRVDTGYGLRSGKCYLNVTAERDRPKPETPNTTSGGRDASTTGSPSQPETPNSRTGGRDPSPTGSPSQPETPNSRTGGRDPSPTGSPSQPERRGWIVLYGVPGLMVVVIVVVVVVIVVGGGTLLGGCWGHSTQTSLSKEED